MMKCEVIAASRLISPPPSLLLWDASESVDRFQNIYMEKNLARLKKRIM